MTIPLRDRSGDDCRGRRISLRSGRECARAPGLPIYARWPWVAGYGAERFVRPAGVWPYQIEFENVGDVAAQTVTVTQQLDADLDWSTFQLGSFGFGAVNVTVPAGLTQYRTTVPYHNADGSALNVLVSLDFNVDTGLLTATLVSINPETGLAPDGVFDGFLYPETGDGAGQGFIEYRVQPLSDLDTGVTVSQQASIVFDTNEAIDTPVFLNTIDADAPVAGVILAPQTSKAATFPVAWAGTDVGSGLDSYDVYVSTNGGALLRWLTNTRAISAVYTGETNHTYGFVAVARDFAGNEQAVPAAPQATVRVGKTPTAVDDAFVVTPGKTLSGSVLGNDVRGRLKLTAHIDTPPAQGTFFLNPNGTFKYTPPVAGFTGKNFFTYHLEGPGGVVRSNVARVDLATHLANFLLTRVSVSEKKKAGAAAVKATLTVVLNAPASERLTVNYVVTPLTALDGPDYTLANGFVSFAAGQKTATFTVDIAADLLDEFTETLQVWLTGTTGPVAVGKNRTATVTIIDDDVMPKVSFRDKTSAAGEDVSPGLEVFLSDMSGRPVMSGRAVTVKYASKNGTAKAGSDYEAATGTLTFAPGDVSKFIPLTVKPDDDDEPDEKLTISLSKAVNAVIAGAPTHTHTILANDPTRTVAFETAATTVAENVKTVTVTVVLSLAAAFPVTVKYAIDIAETATPGKDFTLAPGTLTFPAGETRKTFTVRVTDDTLSEPSETVKMKLSAPANAALGSADAFTLTITDNDGP